LRNDLIAPRSTRRWLLRGFIAPHWWFQKVDRLTRNDTKGRDFRIYIIGRDGHQRAVALTAPTTMRDGNRNTA
jgi:hypothetical protein